MSDLPSLKTIEGALERVGHQARHVADKATWIWAWGYDRRKGDSDGSRGGEVSRPTEATVGHDRFVFTHWAEDGTRLQTPRPASPEWVIRANKAKAAQWILQAAALMEAADGALDQAAKAAGRGDQQPSTRDQQLPRTATKAEVKAAGLRRELRTLERKKGVAHGTY